MTMADFGPGLRSER